MLDLNLPDFELIVWINYNDLGKKLEKEILPETNHLIIYEEIEDEEVKSYHWEVPSWIETLVMGGKLKEFIENPNLIFLKIKANNDSSIEDITLKDERNFKK